MKITRTEKTKFRLEEEGKLWNVTGFFENKSGKLWIHLPDVLREKYHRKDIQGIPETQIPVGSTIEVTVGEKSSTTTISEGDKPDQIKELASYLTDDDEFNTFMDLYEKASHFRDLANQKKKLDELYKTMREKFTPEELALIGIPTEPEPETETETE